MRRVVTVSQSIWRAISVDWNFDARTRESSESTAGYASTEVMGLTQWVGKPQLRLVHEQIGAWRALLHFARMHAAALRVPMVDIGVHDEPDAYLVPWSNGQPWANGVMWSAPPIVLTTAAAARGDDRLRITAPAARVPVLGQIMSDANDWPFTVVSVRPLGGDEYELMVAPHLRADIPAGGRIYCEGRGLFLLREGGNPAYGLNRRAQPEMQLVEYINR